MKRILTAFALFASHRAIGASLLIALTLTFRGVPVIAGAEELTVATGAAEAVQIWRSQLWVESVRSIFFATMMADSIEAVIQTDLSLTRQAGEKITFSLMRKLTGAGRDNDEEMEGHEEAPDVYSDTVTLAQKRNAIKLAGKISELRTVWPQRKVAKTLLKTWIAEQVDDDVFTQFDVSPSTIIWGGDATSTATIDSGDKFTPGLIDKCVAKAEKALPKIWPAMFDGDPRYVVVVHTDVKYDLRQDPTWLQNQRDASMRSDTKHPIFTGALGYHDGCVLLAHEKIPVATNWGSGSDQPGASNFFLARQAGLFAWGKYPEWVEKAFDYDAKIGFCTGAIWDFTKAVFNAIDNGFIAVRTYRTNVA